MMHDTLLMWCIHIIVYITSSQREYVLETLSPAPTNYLTWSESNDECKSRYGTELATFITTEDVVNLRYHAKIAGMFVWIGLNDIEIEGDWKWEDGTQCVLTNGACSDLWLNLPDNIGDALDSDLDDVDCGYWDTYYNNFAGKLGEASCVNSIWDGGYICNANTCNMAINGATECSRTSNCPSTQICNDRASDGTLIPLTGTARCSTYCVCYCLDIPTTNPTLYPTIYPTTNPILYPTIYPTLHPTVKPTPNPTSSPTVKPTSNPTSNPSSTSTPTTKANDTIPPTSNPTSSPTLKPTVTPSLNPTVSPTLKTTSAPWSTLQPTLTPTVNPTPTPNPTLDSRLNITTSSILSATEEIALIDAISTLNVTNSAESVDNAYDNGTFMLILYCGGSIIGFCLCCFCGIVIIKLCKMGNDNTENIEGKQGLQMQTKGIVANKNKVDNKQVPIVKGEGVELANINNMVEGEVEVNGRYIVEDSEGTTDDNDVNVNPNNITQN